MWHVFIYYAILLLPSSQNKRNYEFPCLTLIVRLIWTFLWLLFFMIIVLYAWLMFFSFLKKFKSDRRLKLDTETNGCVYFGSKGYVRIWTVISLGCPGTIRIFISRVSWQNSDKMEVNSTLSYLAMKRKKKRQIIVAQADHSPYCSNLDIVMRWAFVGG